MALRLFSGSSARVRACPACERTIKADAAFCPSCYMVFRPEGTAALREYLQGARIPADVYLLRKMQTEDPNTGPVTRLSREDTDPGKAPLPSAPAPPPPTEKIAPQPVDVSLLPAPLLPAQADEQVEPLAIDFAAPSPSPAVEEVEGADAAAPAVAEPAVAAQAPASQGPSEKRLRLKGRSGVEGLLTFVVPTPPSARSAADLQALFAWMLEHDPFIPNNRSRLEAIHAAVFQGQPVARLGYEQHVLLLASEDLWLHATQESLGIHLGQLVAAYRRAAEAYRKAEGGEQTQGNAALWHLASVASRLRMEAWVYQVLHDGMPPIASIRQRELPLKFGEF
jgi:hypothetical protein